MFDPAGTFQLDVLPERNDVLYGMTQQMEAYYVSYHARVTFYVIGQTIEVPQATAERALVLVQANGPVPKANCTRATSNILRQLPGFDGVGQTFFPNNLADDVAKIPGVQTKEFRENDADDKRIAAQEINAATQADQ